jgi:hypothetical protein
MRKNKWIVRMLLLLLVSAILSVTVSLAAEVGSSSDPLVTLSYLNDTYLSTILSKVDGKISARNSALISQIGSSGNSTSGDTFKVLSLSKGETLTGGIGCEVLLRAGTAVCAASSAPGLVDETTGGTINNGASLAQNHLYMMTIENRGVKASGSVKLLVRGTYSIA